MLQRFQITNLFNLYSYDIDLSHDSEDNIRFITGPNGYGKTTVLRFISAIYQRNLSPLVDKNNPFEKIVMTVDDAVLTIERIVETGEANEADGDEGQNEKVYLRCEFVTPKKKEVFVVPAEKASEPSQTGFNYQLFFRAHRCLYIDDERIIHSNDEEMDYTIPVDAIGVEEEKESPIAERSRKFAEQLKQHIVVAPQAKWSKGEALPEEEYYAKCRDLNDKIARLQKYKLIEGEVFMSPDYDEEALRPLLSANLLRLEEAVEKSEKFLKKVETFERIVRDFEFVDKDFVINPNNNPYERIKRGFRFVLQDHDETKLLNDRLSSGEKHLIIMFYDLLFEASTDELLFLIDEPELSFHLAWQKEYLRILRCVCELRNLQCVLATHSTDIFDSDFEITSDLCEARVDKPINED